MFKLNKKVKYAIVSLKHMSNKKQGELTSAKEICGAYGIPFDPTARALQLMAQQGIVHAAQGAHGGYNITKDLNQVSLRNLNDIIIGPISIADCLKDNAVDCQCAENCIVISPLLHLNERIYKFMDDISIGSLIFEKIHPMEQGIKEKFTESKEQP